MAPDTIRGPPGRQSYAVAARDGRELAQALPQGLELGANPPVFGDNGLRARGVVIERRVGEQRLELANPRLAHLDLEFHAAKLALALLPGGSRGTVLARRSRRRLG